MKKFLLVIAMHFSVFVSAQSPVTQPAGNAATSPSSGCLACAGSTWNNELNVTVLDGNPADISLMQHGFCFQSTCFTSRYLTADQFGFSIPVTATMVGIEVNITRKATDSTAIKDSVVQLMQSGAPAGTVKKSSAYWDTSYTTVTYGSPTDLWGITSAFWTPTAINSSSMGVNLKIFNALSVASQNVYVDYISMTVYFSNTTGIIESQTASTKGFFVSQEQNFLTFSFPGMQDEPGTIKLYNAQGQLVFSETTNAQTLKTETRNLIPGIYFAQYSTHAKQVCKKVLISN